MRQAYSTSADHTHGADLIETFRHCRLVAATASLAVHYGLRAEQVGDDLQQIHGVRVAGETGWHGHCVAESHRRAGACLQDVASLDHVAGDRPHDGGRRALCLRVHPSVVLWVEVRRGCSRDVQVRWVVEPLVSTKVGSACDDLRPPGSAGSCDAASTRPGSGSPNCSQTHTSSTFNVYSNKHTTANTISQ